MARGVAEGKVGEEKEKEKGLRPDCLQLK